ncbi:MAG TPA: DNA topoisomerase IB [Burkholderiales bacterium]|nr:DNA topoisomerase IB [Burkholderiales bacterium]
MQLPLEPAESARAAGLRYVSNTDAGIRRRRAGEGFRYVRADGRAVADKATLARIRRLAIPPAWTEVWICAADDGHLQATGYDARGRKQYRYHPRWHEVRDETKYGRMIAFGSVLPRIRRRVARDLARPGLPREKVLATVVRLLEKTFIRVGNEEYARENESFGLTTLRERQVKVNGSQLRFRFRGKSGVQHEVEVADPRIAAIVRRMQDLPGEELFQYVDEDGEVRAIGSSDVNAYLKEIAGDDFTSKDFRTWAGTLLCARLLCRLEAPVTEPAGRREVARAVEVVSGELRNTRAVCRKCYIHPAVIESFMAGRLPRSAERRLDERALIALLRSEQRREKGLARRSGADGRPLTPLLRRSIARLRSQRPAGTGAPRARLMH